MSQNPVTTHNPGFPRIGADRELKKAVESYWAGRIDRQQLEEEGRQLRRRHWQWQAEAGLDLIPTGDFAWYDQVLTMSATLGNIPPRHQTDSGEVDLDTLFRAARGKAPTGATAQASEMTKWFDTNYHYLVPEFQAGQQFSLAWRQIIEETEEAVKLGYAAKPVILGPISYLWLGKEKEDGFDRLDLLNRLLPAYQQLLQALADAGAEWVQIDEPILVCDLPVHWRRAFEPTYQELQTSPVKVLLATYFGGLEDNLHTTLNLPVDGVHIDAARAPEQIEFALDWLPINRILSIGFVDGRNIWRNDLERWTQALRDAHERIGERLWLAPSCSLLHVPVDLESETRLNPQIMQWLAFARQKLSEVVTVGRVLSGTAGDAEHKSLAASREAVESRRQSSRIHDKAVQERTHAVTELDCRRESPFAERSRKQQARLGLPLFPTTTIGSFPQTAEIRKTRRDYKQGRLGEDEYRERMQKEIAETVKRQEALDLDVLVHGEAERNDMVEYFGEQFRGFAFTDHGWVQSYGSRCVKPPVIYGDVSRPEPVTVEWIRYAQSLTDRPMKGMLTGPTTIVQWSFVRDDQPRAATAQQIALALRDEVTDLEAAGIGIIQIDEPALREGLPLRKNAQKAYLDQAVKAFRLASSGVRDETQIHTHMCYAEFNDIIEAIAALDADVITIETSRSDGELLQAFEDFEYPNQIGPGVYDIHSPNVPDTGAMVAIMERCARKLPTGRLWVNPDCGLKTRGWPETEQALQRMVDAARELRGKHSAEAG